MSNEREDKSIELMVSPDFSPAFEAKQSRGRRGMLHARLATEDPAGVSSAIRRGG